jgi:aminoglycoside phosphotransferase family enzyme
VASDVAFLAMDLDFNDYPDLGSIFVDAYAAAAADLTLSEVLLFYKVYRAYVRAKVTSFLLDGAQLDKKAKEEVLQQAKRYYDLAYRYVTGNT